LIDFQFMISKIKFEFEKFWKAWNIIVVGADINRMWIKNMGSVKGGILSVDIRNKSKNNFINLFFKPISDLFNLKLWVLTIFCYIRGADIDKFVLLHFFTDLLGL
jgi:hypothetical protein